MKRFMFYLAALTLLSFALNADDFARLFVQNGEPFVLDESKELFEFSGLSLIYVDKNLDIYIGDVTAKNMKRYDKNGKLVMVYGRPGQGPGELEFPYTAIVKNEQVIINDGYAMHFSVFDKKTGKFIRTIQKTNLVMMLITSPEGAIYCTTVNQPGKNSISRLNNEFQVDGTFFEPDLFIKLISFVNLVFMDFDNSGNIYVATRYSYKIAVYNKKLELVKIFGEPGRNWNQIKKEIQYNQSNPGEYEKETYKYTYLAEIFVLNNKYLLVIKTVPNKKTDFALDLYDLNGKKLAEDIPSNRMIVGRDYADNIYVYSTKETGDDVQRLLCRYRLRDDIR